jgi:hypothetical protein
MERTSRRRYVGFIPPRLFSRSRRPVSAVEERRTQAATWGWKERRESRTAPSMEREGEKTRSAPLSQRGVEFEGKMRRGSAKMVTVVLEAPKAEEWDWDHFSRLGTSF